ncbi:hypothetical protein HQ590_07110 [bacterium]|nr:hypothetical protein [bacterium]
MYLREIERLEKRLAVRGDLVTAKVIEVERQRVRRSLAEFVAELTISGLE